MNVNRQLANGNALAFAICMWIPHCPFKVLIVLAFGAIYFQLADKKSQ